MRGQRRYQRTPVMIANTTSRRPKAICPPSIREKRMDSPMRVAMMPAPAATLSRSSFTSYRPFQAWPSGPRQPRRQIVGYVSDCIRQCRPSRCIPGGLCLGSTRCSSMGPSYNLMVHCRGAQARSIPGIDSERLRRKSVPCLRSRHVRTASRPGPPAGRAAGGWSYRYWGWVIPLNSAPPSQCQGNHAPPWSWRP